jgi:predicted membrane GTPase involved in stress response
LIHPEFPVEQMLRSEHDAIRNRLSQEIWRRRPAPADDTLYVAVSKGLRVLARTEDALQCAVTALSDRFGAGLIVDVPSVRYAYGAPVLEPYMNVQLSGPDRHLALARIGLGRRRAHGTAVSRRAGRFSLEAEAPLASLLGYAAELGELTCGSVVLSMRLHRYVPIDYDGPEAA